MAKRIALLAVLVLLVLGAGARAYALPVPTVLVADFSVSVDAGGEQFIHSVVAQAQNQHMSAIIIEMNTPGGLLSSMQDIINDLTVAEDAGIKVYAYVVPNGWAASAGSYIAMACDKIFMGDGSAIGSSTPIVVGGTDLEQNHTESFMLAYMVTLAETHNRSTTAATEMVLDDKAFTASEAVQGGVADGRANSISEVLSAVGMAGALTGSASPDAYDSFISTLSDPTVDGFLMLLGVIAILLDLFHGSIALTVVGAISIALGLFGSQLIGAPALALVVFAVAGALIILEVKVSHGFAMLCGIVLSVFGIWLLAGNASGYSPSPFGALQYASWAIVAALAFIGSFYLIKLREATFKRPKAVSPENVVGKEGYMLNHLTPPDFGTANIASEDWTVKCDVPLKSGDRVRAISIDGSVVTVEKVPADGK
ncbi:MAG TPA: nodulation protein NfeD [Conexivisphaerales archaeon]|nr:nodulation protein NfeD [Conexivisphaerales archaeon]